MPAIHTKDCRGQRSSVSSQTLSSAPATSPATTSGMRPCNNPLLFSARNPRDPAGGYITLRSALPPELMTQTLRSGVADIDPLLALRQVQPMDDVVSKAEEPRRFT